MDDLSRKQLRDSLTLGDGTNEREPRDNHRDIKAGHDFRRIREPRKRETAKHKFGRAIARIGLFLFCIGFWMWVIWGIWSVFT